MIGWTRWAGLGVLLCTVVLPCTVGCAGGSVYTHTVKPLTVNFQRTPVSTDRPEKGDVKHFRYYVEAIWDQNAIGQIAKDHGFDEVYYADFEVLSILGIWSQYFVHIYGTRSESNP